MRTCLIRTDCCVQHNLAVTTNSSFAKSTFDSHPLTAERADADANEKRVRRRTHSGEGPGLLARYGIMYIVTYKLQYKPFSADAGHGGVSFTAVARGVLSSLLNL
jgi:hypothetical protein